MNLTPVVKYLLLINVIVAIADMVLGGLLSGVGGLYSFGTGRFLPHQFLTYMFLHANLLSQPSHLFFNMFALWMFGNTIERWWGSKRFLVYYLVCGIGAGIVQNLVQLASPSPAFTVGASGAVYGILLAFGMTFPNERIFIIPIPFPIKAKYFVMFYALVEFFAGTHGSADNVAHFAHLGGMLFGLLLILYWRKHPHHEHYDTGGGFTWGRMKKTPKMKVTNYGTVRESDYEYNARKRQENDEIDRILDKVRQNGYAHLTDEEKRILFDASHKK